MAKRKSAIDPRDEITRGGGIERPDLAFCLEDDTPQADWLNVRGAGNVIGVEAMPKGDANAVFFFCDAKPKKGKEYFDVEVEAARQALHNMLSEGFLPKVYVKGVAI